MRGIALALLVTVVSVGAQSLPALAHAQTAPVAVDQNVAAPQAAAAAPQATNHGAGQAVFFWLFALITIGCAIGMLTRRNAVGAVMFLVASFLGLAALYVLLYAHFVAVIQVLVYAGAIMVLFVFVTVTSPEVKGALPPNFGTTRGMAEMLFGSYLFPFEAVSVVLLIAVIGAIVLAHPAHANVGEEELS
jgi:NADH-quinone oxidoreductase subunit J